MCSCEAFDAQRPATLSPRIAHDLLRGEMGFGGALVTDCLEMQAVAAANRRRAPSKRSPPGADLLLFSHDLDLAVAAAHASRGCGTTTDAFRSSDCGKRTRASHDARSGGRPASAGCFAPHPASGARSAGVPSRSCADSRTPIQSHRSPCRSAQRCDASTRGACARGVERFDRPGSRGD